MMYSTCTVYKCTVSVLFSQSMSTLSNSLPPPNLASLTFHVLHKCFISLLLYIDIDCIIIRNNYRS